MSKIGTSFGRVHVKDGMYSVSAIVVTPQCILSSSAVYDSRTKLIIMHNSRKCGGREITISLPTVLVYRGGGSCFPVIGTRNGIIQCPRVTHGLGQNSVTALVSVHL